MEEPYKYSYHWILHNWLVLMYPEEFARPVEQKVLAQAKSYAYGFKQSLLLGLCNAFLWKSFCLEAFTSFYAYARLFNIVEAPFKQLLNFNGCVVWWCSDGPIYSQEYQSFEINAVTIKISMTEYHHWINGQTYQFILTQQSMRRNE